MMLSASLLPLVWALLALGSAAAQPLRRHAEVALGATPATVGAAATPLPWGASLFVARPADASSSRDGATPPTNADHRQADANANANADTKPSSERPLKSAMHVNNLTTGVTKPKKGAVKFKDPLTTVVHHPPLP
ncbi:hypothetical protein CXG81DRAFT_28909 [Caulochytrium protostelioides]|uniref:Uncharacterized protein n=1 Tax=Caulochytrium protostelioides TaxID=1555241 RepID=A0A4P9WU84_9FUNG|nr:hypothetical protein CAUPRSCDRAFT_12283 [Caulochytrium protostelioides]RKO98260.1 hypothetical protein CXG81DRAFT_28909 [Caulochytrium protostelioides]|eukprot:RKO98260.1 hypothetical protein CXG81DRAFT_28909 [Caulochytrium protostelioides]